MTRARLLCYLKQAVMFCCAVFVCCSSFAENITTSPADCTQPTLSVDTGTANLNAQWEANTIGISWYNDGQKITGDANAATQCTYDHTFSLPTQPTKTGYTFTGWKVVTVPSGYTPLEYIQFSGTQYIDTNFTPNQNTEIRAKYKITTTSACWVYGSGSSQPRITAYSGGSSSGNQRFGNSVISLILPKNQINEVIQNKKGLTINDAFTAYPTVSDFTSTGKFFIGTASASSSTAKFTGWIYYLKIYNAGSIVLNLLPAKRDSDEVIGMYDTVSGTFFTNGGTGVFTANQ